MPGEATAVTTNGGGRAAARVAAGLVLVSLMGCGQPGLQRDLLIGACETREWTCAGDGE